MVTTRDTDISPPAPEEHDGPDDAVPRGRPGQRVAVSVLIVLTLLGVFASNAPDSVIKGGLLTLTRPYLVVTGLDQRWGMFAPNPRLDTSDVVARVDREDGTLGVYPLGSGNALSEYWTYRWLKYGEQLWSRPSADRERAAFVRWIVEQDQAAGHQPVRVTLVRLTRPNLAPGQGPDNGPWREIPFFTTTVGAR
jgi:hypothetical protein